MSLLTTQAKWSGNFKKQRKFQKAIICFLLLMLDVLHASSEKTNYQKSQEFQPKCVLNGFPGLYFNYSVKHILEQYTKEGAYKQIEVFVFFLLPIG